MKEFLIVLSIIAQIESSNNPLAYNPKTQAIGLYQITSICLKEYNSFHKTKYTKKDLFNPTINKKIAFWYLNKRIPQMLKYYKCSVTIENILICYNWGIGNFLKWKKREGDIKKLPEETREYLRKYFKLLKERRRNETYNK